MTLPNALKLITSLSAPLIVGAVASYFTAEAIPGWYSSLQQPSFNPPNWVFGPIWTTLYMLLGVSCFIVWQAKPTHTRNIALAVYAGQLMLNFAWSFLFFYFKRIDLALIEIFVLWLLIVLMIITFYRVKKIAGYINIPYLLWVSFAMILNASYYVLNHD